MGSKQRATTTKPRAFRVRRVDEETRASEHVASTRHLCSGCWKRATSSTSTEIYFQYIFSCNQFQTKTIDQNILFTDRSRTHDDKRRPATSSARARPASAHRPERNATNARRAAIRALLNVMQRRGGGAALNSPIHACSATPSSIKHESRGAVGERVVAPQRRRRSVQRACCDAHNTAARQTCDLIERRACLL